MGSLSEGLTQILIPVAALVGIGFALLQWFLVSRVRVSDYSQEKGYKDRLIEDEEEGVDNLEVTTKCAEIQNAISVGEPLSLHPSFFSVMFAFEILVVIIS